MKTIFYFQAATFKSKSWRDKLAGVRDYAAKKGWQVQIVPYGATAEEIRNLFDTWHPIGCIVDRSLSSSRPPSAVFRNLPTVLFGQNPSTDTKRYANVCDDSNATARLAAEELLQTGVENFSYVPHWVKTHWNFQRGKALAAAVRRAHKRFIPWGESPCSGDGASADRTQRLADRLRALPKPCGLFCANDQVAQLVVHAATEIGLDVPNDLPVVGVDNDEIICESTLPAITSIQPDFQRCGYLAAELLNKVLRHPKTRPVSLTCGSIGVIRRASTRRLILGDPLVAKAMRIIYGRFRDPAFRTADLVQELNCSRSLLELRFAREMGHAIREEIQSLRLDHALDLLRNPHQAITPIPALCGYRSEAFFKRAFKSRTGLTMREWRKQNMPSRS